MNLSEFKLERFFSKYEHSGPLVLCSSDCETFTVKELLDREPGSREAFEKMALGYTVTKGHPALREAIAGTYSTISGDEVLVHVGAEEAIFGFVGAVCEAGDHLIVHVPCFQSLYGLAEAKGCEVTRWEVKDENGWILDLEFLKRSIRKNTRAVILNLPHSPTGYLPDPETFRELIDVVRDKEILLFSDEVYRGMEHNPADRLPAACDLYENAVSLGGLAKSFGLGGLRLGWIATKNRNVYRKMEGHRDYTTVCAPAPSEFLGAIALKHREGLIARNRDLTTKNLSLLNRFFSRHEEKFGWVPPNAGCVGFARLRSGSAEKFCLDLLREKNVVLAPSPLFDSGDHHFRIGFGKRNFPEGLERLEGF